QDQQPRPQRAWQEDQVDRRVGPRDQDVDGAVVEALEEVDEPLGPDDCVIGAAGKVEQAHAQPEDADAELPASVAASEAPQQTGEVDGAEESEQMSQRGDRVAELHTVEHAAVPPTASARGGWRTGCGSCRVGNPAAAAAGSQTRQLTQPVRRHPGPT